MIVHFTPQKLKKESFRPRGDDYFEMKGNHISKTDIKILAAMTKIKLFQTKFWVIRIFWFTMTGKQNFHLTLFKDENPQ